MTENETEQKIEKELPMQASPDPRCPICDAWAQYVIAKQKKAGILTEATSFDRIECHSFLVQGFWLGASGLTVDEQLCGNHVRQLQRSTP